MASDDTKGDHEGPFDNEKEPKEAAQVEVNDVDDKERDDPADDQHDETDRATADEAPANANSEATEATSSMKRPADETPDITKPVKRARSAYFIFADEKRSDIQKQVRTCRPFIRLFHLMSFTAPRSNDCRGSSGVGKHVVVHDGRGQGAVPRKGCRRTQARRNSGRGMEGSWRIHPRDKRDSLIVRSRFTSRTSQEDLQIGSGSKEFDQGRIVDGHQGGRIRLGQTG